MCHRVLHLDVEEWSEELLRQLSYAIRIGGYHARKGPIIGALMP